MSDDAFVAGLQAIVDADDPELEVTFEVEIPRRRRFRNVPRAGTTRVLFGAEWLTASGFTTPSSYAPVIAKHVQLAAVHHVQGAVGRDRSARLDLGAVDRSVPDAAELWETLMAGLRRDHTSVVQVEDGVIEVAADWMDGDGPGLAMFDLDEEIGSADGDENHVVFFRGGFHRSVRAELPPVAGRGGEWPPAEGSGGRWLAMGPPDGGQ